LLTTKCFKGLIYPVRIGVIERVRPITELGNLLLRESIALAFSVKHVIINPGSFSSISHIGPTGRLRECKIHRVVKSGFLSLNSSFSGYQNNTVGSLRTVDGC